MHHRLLISLISGCFLMIFGMLPACPAAACSEASEIIRNGLSAHVVDSDFGGAFYGELPDGSPISIVYYYKYSPSNPDDALIYHGSIKAPGIFHGDRRMIYPIAHGKTTRYSLLDDGIDAQPFGFVEISISPDHAIIRGVLNIGSHSEEFALRRSIKYKKIAVASESGSNDSGSKNSHDVQSDPAIYVIAPSLPDDEDFELLHDLRDQLVFCETGSCVIYLDVLSFVPRGEITFRMVRMAIESFRSERDVSFLQFVFEPGGWRRANELDSIHPTLACLVLLHDKFEDALLITGKPWVKDIVAGTTKPAGMREPNSLEVDQLNEYKNAIASRQDNVHIDSRGLKYLAEGDHPGQSVAVFVDRKDLGGCFSWAWH